MHMTQMTLVKNSFYWVACFIFIISLSIQPVLTIVFNGKNKTTKTGLTLLYSFMDIVIVMSGLDVRRGLPSFAPTQPHLHAVYPAERRKRLLQPIDGSIVHIY